jgi:hypothetical protein
MPAHIFPIGARVRVFLDDGRPNSSGSFTVTGLLPESYEGPLYRLPSDVDGHERVACEATLRPVPPSITRKPKACVLVEN